MLFLQYGKLELDKQYDQRAWAPDAAEVIRRYTQRSEEVRVKLGEPTVFSYGASSAGNFSICMRPAPPPHQSIFLFTEELGAC